MNAVVLPTMSLALALAAGCGRSDSLPPIDAAVVRFDATPGDVCGGVYENPVEIAVAEPALTEASGLAASRRNPNVLWAHNDSGDAAVIYALGTDGAALGRLSLPGAPVLDVEDIAAAPCPDGSGPCLWLADLGNNNLTRTDLALYAVPEPAVSATTPLGNVDAPLWWRFPVSYPGAPVDAEALMVGGEPLQIIVIEKVDAERARVFTASAPSVDGTAIIMASADTMASPGVAIKRGRMITGADLHPSGTRVLLRVYTGVFEYRLPVGGSPAALDDAELVTVVYGPLSEPQGEAVAYDATGTSVWTMSEDRDALVTQPLHHYVCVP